MARFRSGANQGARLGQRTNWEKDSGWRPIRERDSAHKPGAGDAGGGGDRIGEVNR